MPPKTIVTRSQVLEAGFQVVRSEGLSALSARRVAQELGCSTQPVYRIYESMGELKDEVLDRSLQLALDYILSGNEEGPAFLQVGLGSLRFAQAEPELFKAVSLGGPVLAAIQQGKPPPDLVLQRMRCDPQLADLTEGQLTRIHTLLWFFSQGLTSLFLSQTQNHTDPMELAEQYLQEAGRAVIGSELSRSA